MNEMQVFENNEFGAIRIVEQNGEPWFVAADVCRVLGLEQVSRAMDRLDDDEKGLLKVTHPQSKDKTLEMNGVNEAGLYHLVLCSNKPEAKVFKRWITHEVIPAIRKHGGYLTPDKVEEVLLNPDTIIQLATQLKESREKALRLEAANSALTVQKQIMQPKAEYFDELVDRNLLTNFRETAKELKIKEKAFVGFLLGHKYVYRDKRGKLVPYEEKNSGLFELKECVNEKTGWGGTQTLITPKGRETFRLLMQGV